MWKLLICNDRNDFRKCFYLFEIHPSISQALQMLYPFPFTCVCMHSQFDSLKISYYVSPSSDWYTGDGLVKIRTWYLNHSSSWEQEPRGESIKSYFHLLILLSGSMLSTLEVKGKPGCSSPVTTMVAFRDGGENSACH